MIESFEKIKSPVHCFKNYEICLVYSNWREEKNSCAVPLIPIKLVYKISLLKDTIAQKYSEDENINKLIWEEK